MIIICFLEYECGFCCAFGIWVWVLASAPPLKGYSQKWKYENLCNAYMGATKTKSIKGHAILACLWLTEKTIITTTKITDRVSVFFFHIGNTWCDLFIYFLGSCCDSQLSLEIQFTVLSFCSFFMFMFFLRFLFFPILMLAFQFRWKVLLFFYFRIRYRFIFVASYSMIEQSSVCRFKRGAANVKKSKLRVCNGNVEEIINVEIFNAEHILNLLIDWLIIMKFPLKIL